MRLKRRCSGRRADGRPCRGWALKESEPPLCYVHAKQAASRAKSAGAGEREEPEKQDFYSRHYTLEEVADRVGLAMDDSLDDEIAATRIAVRRVMEQLKKELTADEYAHMASLIFRGTNTVARLLRVRRSLSEDMQSEFEQGIGEALDVVGDDVGLDL